MPAHAHSHGRGSNAARILTLSAVATLAYVLLALVMGLHAHSLALVSEAGHNFTDFLALGLTWLGVYLETKPPNASKTYGYQRAGVLAALVNVVSLFVITALIVAEAIHRLRAPAPVATGVMLWVAAVGLVMNGVISWWLEGGRGDVNMRAAFLHMLGDTLACALVIAGALVSARTGGVVLDPVRSLVIAALILASGWSILRETLNILLEGAPAGMRSEQVAADLAGVAGVRSVHDLHIWSLGSQAHALSAHVEIADIPPSASEQIRLALCALLAERYHIQHATLQFELGACAGCSMQTSGSAR
ncbi:MAG: cation diffusion facilitator family transporter [Streptosporangiaceae bacterium]